MMPVRDASFYVFDEVLLGGKNYFSKRMLNDEHKGYLSVINKYRKEIYKFFQGSKSFPNFEFSLLNYNSAYSGSKGSGYASKLFARSYPQGTSILYMIS